MRRLLPVAVVAAALALGWALLPSPAPEAASPAPTPEAPASLTARYALEWRAHSTVGGLQGQLDVAGVLVWSRGPDGQGLRFEHLDQAELSFGGRASLTDVDWTAHQAAFDVGDDGQLAGLRFSPGAPPAWRALLTGLARDLHVVERPGDAWTVTQRSGRGSGPVDYTRQGATLTGVRRAYEAIAGRAAGAPVDGRIVITYSDGLPSQLELVEQVQVDALDLQVTLRLERLELEPGAPSLHALRAQPAGRVDGAAQALAERVDGLTLDAVLADLRAHGALGRMPEHERWLWRTVGLLRQHPEHAATFAAAALTLPARAQQLAGDVLASAGHPQAQAALVHLLEETEVEPVRRHRMVQSMMMLTTPSAGTVDWLDARYTAGGDDARAAANALGATAKALSRMGKVDEADRIVARLAADLGDAEGAEAAALLSALGNSAHPAAEAATAFVESEAPALRAAAARALRGAEGPEVDAALGQLLQDADAAVQRQAVRSVLGRLDEAWLGRLTSQLEAGTLTPLAVEALLAHDALPDALLDHLSASAPEARQRRRARRRLML